MAVLEGFHRFAGERHEISGYTGRNYVVGSAPAIARTQLSSVHLHQRPDGDERYDSTRTSLGGRGLALVRQDQQDDPVQHVPAQRVDADELNDLGWCR